MNSALALAASYGVGVRFADLGEWGGNELRSEYDAASAEIRVNIRFASRLSVEALGAFVALAVGHELYHHRESIREIPQLSSRSAREAAATAFARELLERCP